jgi:hypothetical protein
MHPHYAAEEMAQLSAAERIDRYGFAEAALPWHDEPANEDARNSTPLDFGGHTEAAGLQDLSTKLTQAQTILAEAAVRLNDPGLNDAASLAAKLLDRLVFVDEANLRRGCQVLAEFWDRLLRTGQKQRLNVAASSKSSSGYVAGLVRDRLLAISRDPTVADRIRIFEVDDEIKPFDPSGPAGAQMDETTRAELKAEGLMFVDDWSMSTAQLRTKIDGAERWLGLEPQDMIVNLVYASKQTLREGIEGVDVRACFARPDYPDMEHAPITGSHCAPDDSFRTPMRRVWNVLKTITPDSATHLDLPLLCDVYGIYKQFS